MLDWLYNFLDWLFGWIEYASDHDNRLSGYLSRQFEQSGLPFFVLPAGVALVTAVLWRKPLLAYIAHLRSPRRRGLREPLSSWETYEIEEQGYIRGVFQSVVLLSMLALLAAVGWFT